MTRIAFDKEKKFLGMLTTLVILMVPVSYCETGFTA